jgi:hypothetical protein
MTTRTDRRSHQPVAAEPRLPIGAILSVGGVFLYALLEKHSFENTQDWEFAMLSATFLPTLLIGTVLLIVGSFFDRRRFSFAHRKVHGFSGSQAAFQLCCCIYR